MSARSRISSSSLRSAFSAVRIPCISFCVSCCRSSTLQLAKAFADFVKKPFFVLPISSRIRSRSCSSLLKPNFLRSFAVTSISFARSICSKSARNASPRPSSRAQRISKWSPPAVRRCPLSTLPTFDASAPVALAAAAIVAKDRRSSGT